MKTINTLISLLLCAALAFGAVLPAFAAKQSEVKPTWQNAIESVTPVGDEPFVKLKLSPEGYKITECRLPQTYTVTLKDGTSKNVSISGEPDHFIPLHIYENFFDVETPEGTITLYAGVTIPYVGAKETVFSVGQYVLDGTLGEDGMPTAGSSVYEFPILEEHCTPETEKAGIIVRILFFFYTGYLKVKSWFVSHFVR